MNPDASISDKDDDDKMFEFGLFLSPTLALFRLENSPLQISSYGYLNQGFGETNTLVHMISVLEIRLFS